MTLVVVDIVIGEDTVFNLKRCCKETKIKKQLIVRVKEAEFIMN